MNRRGFLVSAAGVAVAAAIGTELLEQEHGFLPIVVPETPPVVDVLAGDRIFVTCDTAFAGTDRAMAGVFLAKANREGLLVLDWWDQFESFTFEEVIQRVNREYGEQVPVTVMAYTEDRDLVRI